MAKSLIFTRDKSIESDDARTAKLDRSSKEALGGFLRERVLEETASFAKPVLLLLLDVFGGAPEGGFLLRERVRVETAASLLLPKSAASSLALTSKSLSLGDAAGGGEGDLEPEEPITLRGTFCDERVAL